MKHSTAIADQVAAVIVAEGTRKTGLIGAWLYGYETRGGTYMLASPAKWNDSGTPRDLIAILPAAATALGLPTRVLVLTPTVTPELAEALREALD